MTHKAAGETKKYNRKGMNMKKQTWILWMGMALTFGVNGSWAETRQEYLLDALDQSEEAGLRLAPGVTAEVVLEVEASAIRQGDEDASDISLATFELGLDAALMPGLQGVASLLWEEDDTEPVDLDTDYIELGGTETLPVVLSAGRMYVPFGTFNSYMISDPLTLELGETRETAVGVLHEADLFSAWLGAFSGDLKSADGIENAVVALDLKPVDGFTLGASSITDIGEGAGLVDNLNETLEAGGAYEKSPGFSAHLLLELDPMTVAIEYLGAFDDMTWSDAEGVETVTRPEAWHVDVAYALNDAWTGALRYEGSREFKPGEMPEHQCGGTVAWQFNRFSRWSVEYLFGTFEAAGTDDRHQVTTQLALVF